MKYLMLGATLAFCSQLQAAQNHCYASYQYQTKAEVETQIDKQHARDLTMLKARLHIRSLQNHQPIQTETNTAMLVYLEQPEIHLNGLNTGNELTKNFKYPFVLTLDEQNRIQRLYSFTKNLNILDQFWGIADNLHWPTPGNYSHLASSYGDATAKVLATENGAVKVVSAYSNPNIDIEILDSRLTRVDDACHFEKVSGVEDVLMEGVLMQHFIETSSQIEIKKDKKLVLDQDHWFHSITTDPKTWPFDNTTPMAHMSLTDAQALLAQNLKHMRALLEDDEAFLEWVKANMAFLSQLPDLMLLQDFDTDISVMLFWALGAIDSEQSVDIMANVALIPEIKDDHRFRALVGMSGTESALQPKVMEALMGHLEQDPSSSIDSSMLMLIGDFAASRKRSNPDQFEQINTALLSQLNTGNQTKQLNVIDAFGNMQEHATDDVEMTLVSHIADNNTDNRERIAEALEKTKPNLEVADRLVSYSQQEQNNQVKAAMLNAIAQAPASERIDTYLMNEVSAGSDEKVQAAVFNALKNRNFDPSAEQKQQIRASLIGQKDADVIKAAASLLYKSKRTRDE